MKYRKPDYILLGTIVAIALVGLAALLSASVVDSQGDFGNIYAYFTHQILFGVGAGSILGFVAYKINYKKWRALALPVLLFSIFLLLVVFIPDVSSEVGGARRWISVYGFSFQPSEFAKLGIIIYLAAWFDSRRTTTVRRWNEGFIPFVTIVAAVGGLIIFQPDVGTLGVIALIAAFMYFIAGASVSQMGAILILGAGLLFSLVKLAPYRAERFTAFFDRASDPLGISYQINQALLAIGSGGVFGVGLGKSLQKYNFLPEAMKDSIFAVWSEETGLVGALLLITLFLIFTFRGLKIAKNVNSKFGRLVASGITFWIVSQAFINIGSMIGLVPVTGIPLPLVSYGGSSTLVTLIGLGILLNISKYS